MAVHGSPGIGASTHQGRALLIITYITLLLSISATMSSLILTQELSTVALRSARVAANERERHKLELSKYDEGVGDLLTRFNGNRRSWRWVMWHCA